MSCKHTGSSTTAQRGLSPGAWRGAGSRARLAAGSGGGPLQQLLPPRDWGVLGLLFAAEPQGNTPSGDHSVAHTEAMTIIRWGEMLEMLARRSGARRDRWLSENSQGGKICST